MHEASKQASQTSGGRSGQPARGPGEEVPQAGILPACLAGGCLAGLAGCPAATGLLQPSLTQSVCESGSVNMDSAASDPPVDGRTRRRSPFRINGSSRCLKKYDSRSGTDSPRASAAAVSSSSLANDFFFTASHSDPGVSVLELVERPVSVTNPLSHPKTKKCTTK